MTTSDQSRVAWWLWPNLLSLDAPIVALAWTWIFAQAYRVQAFQWETLAVLAAAVWVVYVVDRLWDARKFAIRRTSDRLQQRHEFHWKWRWRFSVGVLVALGFIGWVLLYRVGPALSALGAWVLVPTVLFFALASGSRRGANVPYLKNLAAGLAFAMGVAVPIFYQTGMHSGFLILINREVLFFAILLVLNITALDLWENAMREGGSDSRDASEIALSFPLILLAGFSFFVAINSEATLRWCYYAFAISAALLHILNRLRVRFSLDGLRVLGDCTLLVPFFLSLFVEVS